MSARRTSVPLQRSAETPEQVQAGVDPPHVPAGQLPAPGPEYPLGVADRRRTERTVTERLLVELGPEPSAGAVVRTVLVCARELRAHGVEHGLEAALEAMARSRLAVAAAGGRPS